MKEKLKITSQGSLSEKEYGSIKIEQQQVVDKVITYDRNLDQYSVNGQWEIPFHKNNNSNKGLTHLNKLKEFYYEIKNIKQYLIENQKFESSASARSIEKELLSIIDDLKNEIKK